MSGTSSNTCGTAPTGATTYTFNTNGDRTATTPSSGSATAYTYSSLDQLTQYQLGSSTATTYAYDADHLRMSKVDGKPDHLVQLGRCDRAAAAPAGDDWKQHDRLCLRPHGNADRGDSPVRERVLLLA